ncbi:hypothetical protein G6O69_13810 [Pseudenhygromyxa sp. WMMC2535]|uniref:hypothetical protein n=1 Tax=Pseudenhygromyxa sp. WMMC2535 TaxID=2712867 RepID=UPI0015581457|nr:hypothetical protein [Pseudenhygromyxa sp. WMMC2535]NVB38913.1 hypothetical protein [Pseudenhygromyxa sp. WMMC2535]
MTELGSIFEAAQAELGQEDEAAGGVDLRVSIEVPRAALGHGVRVRVPQRLAGGGDLVERVIDAADPERVIVHLPEQLPAGAVLRLRGQGASAAPGGPAGDLFLAVTLVDRPLEGDELIPNEAALAAREGADLDRVGGRDVTWLVLMALALVAAIVLLVLFS